MNKKELQEKIKKFVSKRVKEDNVSTGAGGYLTKYAYEKPPKEKFQPAVFAKGAKDLSAYKNAGYREVKPSEMIDAKYLWRENINPKDTIKTDVPLFIRLLEYAREDAKTDMDLHNVAEKTIALSGEDRTLTMSDYDNIVGSKTLNETRYSQFKKQTEVVKPSTQMYIAMKEIKKRLQEVNKIANYTNKLKIELSENNDIHYNKRTDVVIEQLMEEIKALYKNLKQIQENGRQS